MATAAVIAVIALFIWLAKPRRNNDTGTNQNDQANATDNPNQPQTYTQERRSGLFGTEYHHFTVIPPDPQRRGLRASDIVWIAIIAALVVIALLS
jgi:hypothetical protein